MGFWKGLIEAIKKEGIVGFDKYINDLHPLKSILFQMGIWVAVIGITWLLAYGCVTLFT